MYQDNRKDIQNVNYSFISLISSKIKVGVIGCGRGGSIKIRHFVQDGCKVEVLSKSFSDDILNLSNAKENLRLIEGEFNEEFLYDKHLIIIAVSDDSVKEKIRKYCDDNYKIYIDSSDFKEGLGVVPVQRSTASINFALNTKRGNPKGAVYVADKMQSVLCGYDEYIKCTTRFRNNAKHITYYKKEILNFIGSEKFKEAFDKNNHLELLKENFPSDIVKKIIE